MRARSGSQSSSPTTTGPPTRFRRAPSSPRSRVRIRSRGCAGPVSSGSSPKLCSAPAHPFLERHLDLVALATVADVVPLLDENRAIARAGLRRLAQTSRPGLRALMRVAHVDPATVDESSIGFRLAPRINASGRLCRPEAALALLLTDDDAEAIAPRRGARGAEPRAAGDRGTDPARRGRADRLVARNRGAGSVAMSSPASTGTKASSASSPPGSSSGTTGRSS